MLVIANRRLDEGRVVEAQALLEALRRQAGGSGIIHTVATELLARSLAEQKQDEEGYALLKQIRPQLSELGLRLLHHLAFRTSRWKEAVQLGQESYQNFPTVDTAVLNALSHASLNEVPAAVGWLQRAQEEGAGDMRKILSNTEFDPIRNDPRFEEYAKSVL